eukprot:5029178-Prymnesium_polylepis.1
MLPPHAPPPPPPHCQAGIATFCSTLGSTATCARSSCTSTCFLRSTAPHVPSTRAPPPLALAPVDRCCSVASATILRPSSLDSPRALLCDRAPAPIPRLPHRYAKALRGFEQERVRCGRLSAASPVCTASGHQSGSQLSRAVPQVPWPADGRGGGEGEQGDGALHRRQQHRAGDRGGQAGGPAAARARLLAARPRPQGGEAQRYLGGDLWRGGAEQQDAAGTAAAMLRAERPAATSRRLHRAAFAPPARQPAYGRARAARGVHRAAGAHPVRQPVNGRPRAAQELHCAVLAEPKRQPADGRARAARGLHRAADALAERQPADGWARAAQG